VGYQTFPLIQAYPEDVELPGQYERALTVNADGPAALNQAARPVDGEAVRQKFEVREQPPMSRRFTNALNEVVSRLETPFEVRSVGGVVRQEGNLAPLTDVIVELKGPGKRSKIWRTKTDGTGRFWIKHAPLGIYALKTTMDGFASVLGTVILSNNATRNSKATGIILELRLAPDGATKGQV
jgi:hypothetical protein